MTRAEWLKTLKSGDRVAVVDAPNGNPSTRIIHYEQVRLTRSGRIHLQDLGGQNWSTGFRRDPGAGPRAIVPVDANGKITPLEDV